MTNSIGHVTLEYNQAIRLLPGIPVQEFANPLILFLNPLLHMENNHYLHFQLYT